MKSKYSIFVRATFLPFDQQKMPKCYALFIVRKEAGKSMKKRKIIFQKNIGKENGATG